MYNMMNSLKLLTTAGLAACASAAAPTPGTTGSATTQAITESDVRRILSTLAADSLEGRKTGSRGADKAAAFIAAEMKALGMKPAGDSGTFLQKVPFVSVVTTAQGGVRLRLLDSLNASNPRPRVFGYNVIGIIPGIDSALKNEVVAFAAHYDHVGIGEPVNGDSIYNGADDDASGVTTVLGIARAFSKGSPPRRTLLFLITTGEEQGILGTRWYIAHAAFPLSQMVAQLDVEMTGRPDSLAGGTGKLWMTGYDRSTMGTMLRTAGLPIVADPYPQFKFFERSDNIVFAQAGIPAHTLSSYNLHPDYHKPSDDVSRIDFAHLTAVTKAAAAAARVLSDGPAPKWNPGGQPPPRQPR